MTKVIKIEGMTCMHCSGAVTKALNAVPGVNNVNVDLDSGNATVDIMQSVTDELLSAAIVEAGYEVLEIT